MNSAARAYTIQFLSAMVAYAILLVVSIYVLQANPTAPWRGAVAVLPAVPTVLALLIFIRFLGQMDELQRRIQFDAVAFAAGATAILTFTWGLLENAGFPHISLIWVLPLMTALWGIAAGVSAARYW
ncbi:MAG TPA: hypothetical protein VFW76_08025 [Ktedonobacterales bacterium]|nr:hypothetical protein [Ktedonobacterales bacterium]